MDEGKFEHFGQYEYGGEAMAMDPSYRSDDRGVMALDLPVGNYDGYVRYADDGHIAELLVMDCQVRLRDVGEGGYVDEEADFGDIGVDSGCAGIFCSKPNFSDGEWDNFYKRELSDGDGCWVTSYGLCCETGGSDGEYPVLGWFDQDGSLRGASIVFIDRKR